MGAKRAESNEAAESGAPRPEPVTADRHAHFVYDSEVRESAMEGGTPVTSVCGKVWVPSREPFYFPLCPTCAVEALNHGWMA